MPWLLSAPSLLGDAFVRKRCLFAIICGVCGWNTILFGCFGFVCFVLYHMCSLRNSVETLSVRAISPSPAIGK